MCVCLREEASFCAVVDGDGELGDFLRLPHIMKRRGGWNRDDAELKVTITLFLGRLPKVDLIILEGGKMSVRTSGQGQGHEPLKV